MTDGASVASDDTLELLKTPTLSGERAEIAARPLPINSSFSTILPTLQLAWDSTSLGALKTCPEYYNLSVRQGYTLHAQSVHLVFGILYHSAGEMYDRLRVGGSGIDRKYYRNLRRLGVPRETARKACLESLDHGEALLCVVRFILCSTWDFAKRRPWQSDDPTKNRETLLRTVIWYLDQFQNDPMVTYVRKDGRPAVEQSFRFDSGLKSTTTDETFLLCGHLDKLAWFHQKVWVLDRKTTKGSINQDYFDKYSPDNQVSLYSFAGTLLLSEPIAGLMIDAAQVMVTGSRFQRGQIARSASQNEEWLKDVAVYLQQAESYAIANHWPKNDKSCNQYGGCAFRQVCGAPPEVRPTLLKAYYTQRVWDPLKTREA